MSSKYKKAISTLLENADVEINGSRPWDIHVMNDTFYSRVLAHGSLGLGESYMEGHWESEQIDELVSKLLSANLNNVVTSPTLVWNGLKAKATNRQSKKRSHHIGEAHYDIGNDLYNAMLDNNMVYTCGYWKESTNLDDAQIAKLDLVCKKIGLQKDQKVLDIGCGWGSFAKFAAEKYGAHVIGITVSKEQLALGRERCKGLPVDLRLQDYRDFNEPVDHIVSLGMIEHVGYKNYRSMFEVAERCISNDGLFLLHTIGGNRSVKTTDPWIEKYIFPNSMIPSAKQLSEAAEGLFVMEDWHNFGPDYDKTLLAWMNNFDAHWDTLKDQYDEKFYRMWKFYLLSCAGSFRCRMNQLWQIVYSKNGVQGGYTTVR